MNIKKLFWTIAILVIGFALGKLSILPPSQIQTSIISASQNSQNSNSEKEDEENFERDMRWLNSYEISPQKIADSVKK